MGSAVGTLLGGGSNNSGFTASSANILNPTTVQQAQDAYTAANTGVTQQQALAQALAAQGTQGMNSQAALAQALQAQANGQGPNPAQAALAQNTAANTSNQAALMAGQRGSAANAGLIARQAAQQGAVNQQNSIGQAATLGAQQQLAAQQQQQQLAATQIGQQATANQSYNQAAQGEQQNLLNSIAQQNNANVGMQSNINNANASIANTNANNTANSLGGLINGAGGVLGNVATGLFSGGASGAGGLLAGGAGDAVGALGGALPAIGEGLMDAAPAVMMAAKGGMVRQNDVKPPVGSNPKLAQVQAKDRLPLPQHIKGMASIYHPHILRMADGGDVSDVQTPTQDNTVHAPSEVQDPSTVSKDSPLRIKTFMGGGQIPGKPKVNHNDVKNDVVPAMLTPKEIVLPLSVTQADDAPEKAKAFVEALLKKQGKSASGKEHSDFKEALKRAISSRKSA
jgi:hypothetical protein